MPTGWFITFEGGEGSGKSTQLRRLQVELVSRGREVVVSREPGGTPLAEGIRNLLLDPEHDPDGLVEMLLLAAARRDHVARVIRPALARGAVVLCDRFSDSSLVYQGAARGVGGELVARINRVATEGLEPDLTLVFDIDPEEGVSRARSRNLGQGERASRLDDEDAAFHRRVRLGFLELAEQCPQRVRLVDASGDEETVFERVLELLPEELQ